MTDGHPRRWWILGFLCLSLVIIVASVSSVTVALPSIQIELEASGTDLQWIVDSYALLFACLLLPLGSLGDHIGRRRVLLAGLIIFGTATGIAAAADAAYQIIIMRAIMGTAAAFIMPATLSILTEVFSAREVPRAIAIWAAFAGAGGMIGPVGSGLALKWFWWGGVFLLVIPLVAVAIFGAIFVIPESRTSQSQHAFDPLGAVLSIAAIGAFVFGVIEGPNYGWGDPLVVAMFTIAFCSTVCFIFWERSVEHPMLDPTFFRSTSFSLNSLVMTVMFFGIFGLLFLLTQYFQFAQGHSPLDAGLRVLPSAVAMLLIAPRSARLADLWGTRKVVSVGLLILSLGLAGVALVTVTTPYWVVAVCLVMGSSGAAITMPTVTERIVSSLPREKAGVGSAVNDTTREVGGSIGIAVVGSLTLVGYRREIGGVVEELVGKYPSFAGLIETARDSIGRAGQTVAELQGRATSEVVGDVAMSLGEATPDAFDFGMTLGLGVAAGVIFLTSVVVAVWYPSETVAEIDIETSVPPSTMSALASPNFGSRDLTSPVPFSTSAVPPSVEKPTLPN